MDESIGCGVRPRPLSGPRGGPQSRTAARQLVVFLHGWGSSGDDLIQLAPLFAAALPDAEFVSPHGPERCDQNPGGFQWFSLARGEEDRRAAAARAVADLEAFLEVEQQQLGLPENRVALVVAELAPLGARVRYHVRPRLGHSIDQEGIALGADFLRRQFLG